MNTIFVKNNKILREYGGKIALFRDAQEQPLALYEPSEELFPADEQLLREGICIKTEDELSRLIEDLNLE